MNRLLPLFAALAFAAPAAALPLTFEGDFTADNQIETIAFTLAAPTDLTIVSTSWVSGELRGGFDPIVIVTDPAGNVLRLIDDGRVGGALTLGGESFDFGVWDAFDQFALDAGDYRLIIVQYDNYPFGLNVNDGFSRVAQPDFTFALGFGGGTQPLFNGTWDDEDPRTSFWRVHLLGPGDGVLVRTPAPGALALFGLGFAALGLVRRR